MNKWHGVRGGVGVQMKLSPNYNEQHDAERVGRPMDSYIAAALINRVFLHD